MTRTDTTMRPTTTYTPANEVKFNLIDKIEFISPDRIVACKQVSLAEEYLADHFPTFPVLPGVLMLEALVQAAGWILHHRYDFACSMAVLREVRNVKYGQFVAPGSFLRVEVDVIKVDGSGGAFKAAGQVGDLQAVSARLHLAYFNLGAKQSELAAMDDRLRENNRRRWSLVARQSTEVLLK
jgi:3-hydroxyacyl-[acyl-carrier-protein] dehydratase